MAETAIVPNDDYSVDHDPAAKGFRLKGDEINPGANMVYGTNGAGVKGWQAASAADGSETIIEAGANVTVTGTGTAADPYEISTGAGGGGDFAHQSLSSGNLDVELSRFGGTAAALTSPAAGEFNIEMQAGSTLLLASIFGNNTTLNASQEIIIRIDNSANTRDRRVTVHLYDANNGAIVNQFATGTAHTVVVAGNITTITIPGMNGFGGTGFFIEIR